MILKERIKLIDGFYLDEFFDEKTYRSNKPEDLKRMIDMNLIIGISLLRKNLKTFFIINNWAVGGKRQWSGYRTKSSPQYKPGSMHSVGKAIDFISYIMTAETIRQHIRDNYEIYKPYIKRIESGVSWVHIDSMKTNSDNLIEFKA